MQSWLCFSLLAGVLASVGAVNFVCPTNTISSLPSTGTIPNGAATLTNVLPNTNCTIKFNIPNGYAVKLQISNNGINGTDAVTVVDTVGKRYQTQPIVTNSVIWFASGSASMGVLSPKGNLMFFATYQYVALNTFAKQQYYTGSYFYGQLAQNTVYTMSTHNLAERVAVSVGKSDTRIFDSTAHMIYVYDGDNILNTRMMGRLTDLATASDRIYSSGTSLSFVCFYNQGSVRPISYILGNDASAVSGLTKYAVATLTTQAGLQGSFTDGTNPGSAYTFICLDCVTMYLNKFSFDTTVSFNGGYTELRGQTPTHRMETLIKFPVQTFLNTQIPQIIPTKIFTMYLSMARAMFTIDTNSAPWLTPVDKRSGVIISPNKWDASMPASFAYTFRNNSQLFNYNLRFDKAVFGAPQTDSLVLMMGPANGNPTINNNYPKTTTATGQVSSVGNYMTTALVSTSLQTDVRMTFTMNVYKSASSVSIMVSCLAAVLVYLR